jgi:hypothetical protein
MAVDAELLTERTFLEVRPPLWVERVAQQALGHNSKAVHRAYAKKAKVRVPALEDYERAYADRKIIPLRLQNAEMVDALRPETPASIR